MAVKGRTKVGVSRRAVGGQASDAWGQAACQHRDGRVAHVGDPVEALLQKEGAPINAPLLSLVHVANFSGAFRLLRSTAVGGGRRGFPHRCAFVKRQINRCWRPGNRLQLAGTFDFAKSVPKRVSNSELTDTFPGKKFLGIAFGGGRSCLVLTMRYHCLLSVVINTTWSCCVQIKMIF